MTMRNPCKFRFKENITCLLLAAIILCCNSAIAQNKQARDSIVKVGAIYGLSGPLADFSNEFKNGADMFLDFQRDDGGTNLSILYEDSKWDPKTAVSAYRKLVNFDQVKIVHVMGSGTSMAIKPLSEHDRVLLFSAGAHPDLLTNSSLVLRHANVADHDAKVLAEDIFRRVPDTDTIASIFIQNEWGQSYNNEFQKCVRDLRPGATFASDPHMPEETEFRTHLLRLMSKKPQVFMVNSSGPAAGMIIKEIYRMGFKGKIFANNGLVLSGAAQKLLHDAGIGGFYYQIYPAVGDKFRAEYKKLYGKASGYFAVAAYTDFELLHHAVTKVGDDPKAIIDFIKGLGEFEGRFETLKILPDGDIRIETLVDTFKSE